MAEAVTIEVQPRDPQKNKGTGSRVARRLRAQGRVPAIVYGHKQDPQPISLSREDVALLLKRGGHLTELKINGQGEMALIRDVQWDHLGKEIIHLDFFRVNATETITAEVRLELHGTPPGLSEGGMVEQPTHAIPVTCKATDMPDSIRVEVGGLHINGMIHVKELALPPGVTTAADPDLVLVHIVPKTAISAGAAPEGTPESAEPTQGEGEADNSAPVEK
jgi:large subunit ribosomal protein L25